MAKRTESAPGTPRKRTTAKKKPNGEIESTPDGIVIAPPEPEPSDEDIRVRAYHRYLERGGNHGADFDDWVEAEKDLKRPRS
jgi:Protein of unknown function (DUF2934)